MLIYSPSIAETPNILNCRLTKELVADGSKPELGVTAGKKIESKAVDGTPSALSVTFIGLNSRHPKAKSDLLLSGGKEQGLQLLHREERRITLGYFETARQQVYDVYFPKTGKPFVWLHLLTTHYQITETPPLDMASWGECD